MISLVLMVRGPGWYSIAAQLLSAWLGVAVALFVSRPAIDAPGGGRSSRA